MKTSLASLILILLLPCPLQAADWLQLMNKANQAHQDGRLDAALELANQALGEAQRKYGKDSTQAGNSLNELALIEAGRGNYQQALDFITRAVDIASKVQGSGNENTLVLQLNQGLLALAAQNHSQAVEALQVYLDKRQGAEDEAALRAWRAMGYAKLALKDYLGAEQSARQTLALYAKRQPLDPLQQATYLDLLTSSLHGQRRFEEALPQLQQALDLRRKSLGDGQELADSLIRLADQYSMLGRNDEALPLQDEAMAILEKIDPEGESIGLQLYLKAVEHQRRQEYQQAEPLYQRSLDILAKHGKGNSLDAAILLANFAELKSEQREGDAALELFRRALEIHANDGSRPQQHAKALYGRGVHYIERGRHDLAEPDLRKSLKLSEEVYGQKDYQLLPVLQALERVYKGLGRELRLSYYQKRIKRIRDLYEVVEK